MKKLPLYLAYTLAISSVLTVIGALMRILHIGGTFSTFFLAFSVISPIIFIILIIFMAIRLYKKTDETKNAKLQKEIAKLQLNSIRSQLNPHFLFNALSGIQNLINKNEIDNANKYLSKFARLTRNVLDDKEQISLAQEKTLLDDYLQMEQLRFGFSYEIKTDDNLDLQNIEIPSMLLQPFVENSVKHGIASKTTEGNIEIAFSRHGNNLLLRVADNGKGFDADKKHEGLGLSLSKNRISLLNSIYKETPFSLAINSSSTGSEINLTLTDWL
ncbi:histidine kinase [Pedobacter sp. UBA4863]|uniref:sensor histidine kinase n=1 Tax=Pedobacter sp. UBA4863 TaxID=1947060 RepID=UPI0025F70120|nr:histidine kinase [Pedobacter sp. UBA4863]